MHISIRAKLTLFFTVLFGALVVALATGAYVAVRRDLNSKLNFGLQVTVDATGMAAQHELSEHAEQAGGDGDIRQVLNDNVSLALPETQILVKEGSRMVAYRPGEGTTPGVRTAPDIRQLQLHSSASQTTAGMQVVMRELPVPKFHTSYQIYAATPVASMIAQLLSLQRLLLVSIPLGLGLAALAGYLLARKLLAPLQELSQTIAGIQSSSLSARVRVENLHDEIGSLGCGFNSLLDRLEQTFTLQRRFMADASHELRTPVTVALTAAQATVHDGARSQRDCEEALRIVGEQMLRLRRIVGDMLFLSQTDVSPSNVFRQMYLDDAVAEAARAAQTLAREKRQALEIRALPEAPCLGDAELLQQAILVLLENAIKFTPEEGSIEIDLYRQDSKWVCSVTDSGIGIAEEAQPRIFERFYRGAQALDHKVPGAGLGLAIATTILEKHAGSLVLAESRPGRTRFEIAVSAVETAVMAETTDQASCLAVKI